MPYRSIPFSSESVGEPQYFRLNDIKYSQLVSKKEEILREVEAMQVIVSAASMNPLVLMRDVLNKKKRIIARIDATDEGQKFLMDSIRSEEQWDSKRVLARRLKISKALSRQRDEINVELADYQKGWNKFSIADEQKKSILTRYIEAKVAFLTSTSEGLVSITGDIDNIAVFLNMVLIDELNETKENLFDI
jgi:hypothetical protein